MKLLLITLLMVLLTGCALAKSSTSLTAENAIRACMGEAEGESQTGKIAMMEALRNRNSLKGVYGHSAIVLKEGSYFRKIPKTSSYFKRTGKALRPISNTTVIACRAAWVDSAYTDYVKGADHWEAVQTFGKPNWASKATQTAKIGSHTFFKDVK